LGAALRALAARLDRLPPPRLARRQHGIDALVPGLPLLLDLVNFSVSFGFTTVLFALVFKILPDARIAWRDVWVGAAVTALLFTIGKDLISLYIGSSNAASTYGAAAGLVILLLWVYWSSQILLLGAEIAKAWQDARLTASAARDSSRSPVVI
jgi:membrane protein